MGGNVPCGHKREGLGSSGLFPIQKEETGLPSQQIICNSTLTSTTPSPKPRISSPNSLMLSLLEIHRFCWMEN